MGIYINPPLSSKELFLEYFGKRISEEEFLFFNFIENKDILPVCLIDNGYFTAADVAYCASEIDAFLVYDSRPRKFYTVPKANLFCEEASGISEKISEILNKDNT